MVLMAKPAERPAVDPTFYPWHEKVGESTLQMRIVELLRPLLERWLAERGVRAFVGADQFIYWVQFAPRTTIAPDLYVMPGFDPDVSPKCWKLWEHGVAPSFALEVVSGLGVKDYTQSPAKYDEMGARELVIFDPRPASELEWPRFQVYRRAKDGGFPLVRHTNGDRVPSRALGGWLRAVGDGGGVRLRLATGTRGEDLVPTDAEIAVRERATIEELRAAREVERGAADAEIARLRAEIERLRRG